MVQTHKILHELSVFPDLKAQSFITSTAM